MSMQRAAGPMTTGKVMRLPDGRFRAETPGWSQVFTSPEDAVAATRTALDVAGGGQILVLSPNGHTLRTIRVISRHRQDLSVPTQSGGAQQTSSAASTDATTTQTRAVPGRASGPQAPSEPSPAPAPAGSAPQPAELVIPADAEDLVRKPLDKAMKSLIADWWSTRSQTTRAGTALIAFALSIGPLGQGFLAAVGALMKNELPSSKQLEALFWLIWMTAPLMVPIVVLVTYLGKRATSGVLAVAGVLAVGVVRVGLYANPPEQLAGLFCYADYADTGIAYEQQCRTFQETAFLVQNLPRFGSPTALPDILASALSYTIDARGAVMALAGVVAAVGLGMVLRERV